MLKSILPSGEVVYGVDYSHIIGATVEEISDSDFFEASEETYAMTDAELTELKRQEMQSLIDLHYPLETRLTYMNAGIFDSADTDFTTMNTYINGIKAEFDTNGKDADFTARM